MAQELGVDKRHRGVARAMCAGIMAVTLAALTALPALAQPRYALYDISYRWSVSLPSIYAYRTRVSHVMGRRFTSRLTVVKWQSNYGLIYRRHGYYESAAKTARRHSNLLTRHGLSPAAVVAVRRWTPIFVPRTESFVRERTLRRAAALVPVAVAVPAGQIQQIAALNLNGVILSYIDKLRQIGFIRPDETTAWSVYDLTSDQPLVSINEDVPFEAASLIKPFIALAYFKEVSEGQKNYTDFTRERMEAMIQDSDNAAADYFLRRMGGPAAVSRLLKKNYGSILRDMHLVEYIPYSGRTYRNKASAHDYSRFLYALWKNQLPYSGELMRLMNLPKPNRLYTGAAELPRDTAVYDKTGTTSRLCGDMGILVVNHNGHQYPYIVVGIIQKERSAHPYFAWMIRRGNVIRQISDLVYDAIAGRHGFNPALSASAAPAQPVIDARAANLAE